MTTTQIEFAEKQDFEIIKLVIEKEFCNVKIHSLISDLKYISFDFCGESIYCHFMKDNQIHHSGGKITHCSTFASDRPNENKTKAFKKIAKYFDCVFRENDCADEFEVFFHSKHAKQ